MAAALITWLAAAGWEVFQEVSAAPGIADIVARKDGVLWVLECKLQPNFEVLGQALRWQHYAHRVSIVVPRQDAKAVLGKICVGMQVGLILVSRRWATEDPCISEVVTNRAGEPKFSARLTSCLSEEQKTFARAGTNAGYWTPFKSFAMTLCAIVNRYPHGVRVHSLAKEPTLKHYKTEATFRACVTPLAQKGVFNGIRAESRNNLWYLVPCSAEESKI